MAGVVSSHSGSRAQSPYNYFNPSSATATARSSSRSPPPPNPPSQHSPPTATTSSSSLGSYYQHYYSSFRRKHAPMSSPSQPLGSLLFSGRRNGPSGRPIKSPYSNTSRRAASSAKAPTFWIGMMMCFLAVVYVMVVVVVTRFHMFHLQPPPPPSSPASPAAAGHENNNIHTNSVNHISSDKGGGGSGSGTGQQASNKGGALDPRSSAQQQHKPGLTNQQHQNHPDPEFVLKAYAEPTNFDEWDVKPLPARSKARKSLLKEIPYPQLNQCSRLPEQWPVNDDAGEASSRSNRRRGNPVDHDPFLPWIHDVFPTDDGKYVQFVAQNRRRCRTGVRERHIMDRMQPQAALFQHVSVKRLANASSDAASTRYKLVPYDEADADGVTTRFICRFKQSRTKRTEGRRLPDPRQAETLAIHNLDYDWTGFRKRYKAAFLKDDGGIKSIHTTQLLFRCPIPPEWQDSVRNGSTVVDDYATLFVDVVPIRTPPRYGITNRYLAPWFAEFNSHAAADKFDPLEEFGTDHVLPMIDDSGRWENVPICLPSLMAYEGQKASELPPPPPTSPYDTVRDSTAMASVPMASQVQKHRLVSCIWASSGYATRGERFSINDGQRRLMEWLHHNINIGFDHFYLYDNSDAFDGNTNNLKGVADLFPDHVSYINWPSKVCNNRPNNVDSPGERSSQYAAESSCRLRFGPHVEWIGQFDIDEYLIPMGEHDSALSLLDKLDKEDTRIVSFGSWRAWPRFALIEEPVPITSQKDCWHTEPCFDLRIPLSTTMLQAYNCDRQPPGQKKVQMPAEKQLYRPAYVTQHFVHYSAATILSALNRTAFLKAGFDWWRRPFPDPRQRFANELEEGLMIHSKAVAHQDTAGWKTYCSVDSLKLEPKDRGMCRLGVPFPSAPTAYNHTDEGWMYNCYVNRKVEDVYVPKLEVALKSHLSYFDAGMVTPKF